MSERLLWIDPAMGMAGDMFAAALIGLGVPEAGMVAAMRTAGQTVGAVDVQARPASLPDGTTAWRLDVTVQEARPPLPIADAPVLLVEALTEAGVEGIYADFAMRALEVLCVAERVGHGAAELEMVPTRQVSLAVIGHAHTPYRRAAPYQPDGEAPLQEGTFYIELEPAYAAGLSGLETFSHIYVISYLDRSHGYKLRVRPPWREDDGRFGLFATRSPNRPSPIGLTRTQVLRVEGNRVITGPLDLFDGTPILDIKPFIRSLDGIDVATQWDDEAGNDGWLEGSDHLELHRRGRPHDHPGGGALHEAQDIILDVTGAAWGLQALDVDLSAVTCLSPVRVGGGSVDGGSHGRLPVPAPATMAILHRYRIPHAAGPVEAELLTPTGAAILAALTPAFLSRGSGIPTGMHVGVGLGQRDFGAAYPNVLRLYLSAEGGDEGSE